MVKSKSMLTEECEMNPYLESKGIEVVETDLGERIIQLKGQKPSHIVMPAIHLNHDDVGELFEEKLGSEKGNHDPTYLTYVARLSLRNEFLTADAGMTGGNFGIGTSHSGAEPEARTDSAMRRARACISPSATVERVRLAQRSASARSAVSRKAVAIAAVMPPPPFRF